MMVMMGLMTMKMSSRVTHMTMKPMTMTMTMITLMAVT